MPVEGRGQVTGVGIDRSTRKREEPTGLGGRRQPSFGGTSRMNREVHVRICERLGVKLPGATRLVREIRTLRAMWRALETGLRQLLNGHEEGNLGYKPRRSLLRAAAPVLDPTRLLVGAARRLGFGGGTAKITGAA
jgi:hypothetical protein